MAADNAKKPGPEEVPDALQAHALTVDEIHEQLDTNLDDGLHASEAASRAGLYGLNELDDGPGVQPLKILAHQVANGMILVMRSTSQF